MKYALISDIHANLPALDAVLADIDARTDIDAIFHLDDLVGYGPWPNETVDRIIEKTARAILASTLPDEFADFLRRGRAATILADQT